MMQQCKEAESRIVEGRCGFWLLENYLIGSQMDWGDDSCQFHTAVHILTQQKAMKSSCAQSIKQCATQHQLENQHQLKLYQIIDNKPQMCLVYEYVELNLHQYLLNHPQMSEHTIANIIEQLIDAVQSMHSQHIPRREINPTTILVDQHQRIRVNYQATYSHSPRNHSKYTKTQGDAHHKAGNGNNNTHIDLKTDIASIASILCGLYLCRNSPYPSQQLPNIFQRMKHNQLDINTLRIPKKAKEFLLRLKVPSGIGLEELSKHQWMRMNEPSSQNMNEPSSQNMNEPSSQKQDIEVETFAQEIENAYMYLEETITRPNILQSLESNAYDSLYALYQLYRQKTLTHVPATVINSQKNTEPQKNNQQFSDSNLSETTDSWSRIRMESRTTLGEAQLRRNFDPSMLVDSMLLLISCEENKKKTTRDSKKATSSQGKKALSSGKKVVSSESTNRAGSVMPVVSRIYQNGIPRSSHPIKGGLSFEEIHRKENKVPNWVENFFPSQNSSRIDTKLKSRKQSKQLPKSVHHSFLEQRVNFTLKQQVKKHKYSGKHSVVQQLPNLVVKPKKASNHGELLAKIEGITGIYRMECKKVLDKYARN